MSNIYIQEPPTKGKVLLITSVGEIDIELWSKECPKACRNFIQLCMEGYYDDTVFHRLVKDFIVQGGDPTGTGNGGDSIYGKPFKDEFHSRLRFNRRGLVGMANAGVNNNASQFFFTLGEAGELNKKHTLFGKIAGPTVYNMLKLGDCDTDSNDRPSFLQKIISTQILNNPFDDIKPRAIQKKQVENSQKKISQSKATKNFNLLSFGEEAEEDEEEINEATEQMRGKSKSSHDLIDDPKLSSTPVVETDTTPAPTADTDSKKRHKEYTNEDEESLVESEKKKQKKETDDEKPMTTDESEVMKLSRKEELRNEVRQLQKELMEAKKRKREKLNPQKTLTEDGSDEDKKLPVSEAVSDFKNQQLKYKELKGKNRKKGSGREDETLAILARFKSRLQEVKEENDGKEEITDDKLQDDETNDDVEDDSWLAHKLSFVENKNKVLDANVDELDRYEIFDPRNPVTKRRRENSKQLMKAKKT